MAFHRDQDFRHEATKNHCQSCKSPLHPCPPGSYALTRAGRSSPTICQAWPQAEAGARERVRFSFGGRDTAEWVSSWLTRMFTVNFRRTCAFRSCAIEESAVGEAKCWDPANDRPRNTRLIGLQSAWYRVQLVITQRTSGTASSNDSSTPTVASSGTLVGMRGKSKPSLQARLRLNPPNPAARPTKPT